MLLKAIHDVIAPLNPSPRMIEVPLQTDASATIIKVHPKHMDSYLHNMVFDHFYVIVELLVGAKWVWFLRVSAGRWVLQDVEI